MLYFIIILNIALGMILTSAAYPVVGLVMLIFYGLMLSVGCSTAIGPLFIKSQMKHWGNKVDEIIFSNKRLLMSVACLTFSLKISIAIAIFIEAGAVLLLFFAFFIALGYFYEPPRSVQPIKGIYALAVLIVKIASFLSIGFDRVAEWITKLELRILNINY